LPHVELLSNVFQIGFFVIAAVQEERQKNREQNHSNNSISNDTMVTDSAKPEYQISAEYQIFLDKLMVAEQIYQPIHAPVEAVRGFNR
jgi:hypothetical protein